MISRKTENNIWDRHIIDSLQLVNLIPNGFSSFVDIGSGAGLPGIVLKIANESLEANLVESNKKKSQFLENVSNKLEIKTNVFNKRFEEIIELKSQNVLLISRALCSLDNLLSMGLDYFNNGSVGIFHKGISWKKEIIEAQKNWQFHYTPHQSLTNKSSRILLVKDVIKK